MDGRGGTLTDAVLLASRALVGIAARSLAGVEDEVTLPQFRVLVVIASRGDQHPGDLAVALDVHPSSATRLCDRLEARGLINRGHAPGNRREVLIGLTPKGRSLVDRVTQARRREISRIVGRIPRRDQVALVKALGAFTLAAGEVPEPSWSLGWASP